jgi:hypothetical protein
MVEHTYQPTVTPHVTCTTHLASKEQVTHILVTTVRRLLEAHHDGLALAGHTEAAEVHALRLCLGALHLWFSIGASSDTVARVSSARRQ